MALDFTGLYAWTPTIAAARDAGDPTGLRNELQSVLTCGYDAVFTTAPSTTLCEAIHHHGMKVFVEFPVFQGDDTALRFPEAVPMTADGRRLRRDGWYQGINPANEPVREERLAAFDRLVRSAPIDGVWLDFIRWPGRWESPSPHLEETGFDRATVSQFFSDHGERLPRSLASDETYAPGEAAKLLRGKFATAWYAWKRGIITRFVAAARDRIKAHASAMRLGVFGVPWLNNDSIDAVICQDYPEIARLADYLSPMVYHGLCGRTPSWVATTTRATKALGGTTAVAPIVEAPEVSTVTGDEFVAVYRELSKSSDAQAVIAFKAPEALRYPLSV